MMKYAGLVNKIIIIFFILLSSISILSASNYEKLGNPYLSKYITGEMIYARNIWDMQLFDQKIYLGAGNSSNHGPAPNAGRVPLIYWDLSSKKFIKEYTIAEEQVDSFKIYGDSLYIPGHDATQKWILGNIYKKTTENKKKQEKWKKYRTLPDALHVYDLVIHDNKIFTAIGLKGKGAVFVSDDNAQTWKKYSLGKGRVYSFLKIGNELFATKTFKKKAPHKISVYQWKKSSWIENSWSKGKSFIKRSDLNLTKLFPKTKFKNGSFKLIKALSLNDSVYYLGAYKHNDHQSKPFGLYKATINKRKLLVEKLTLPKNFTPRDMVKRGQDLFVLINWQGKNNTQVKVLKYKKQTKKIKYAEILTFNYPTFARSFEKNNNCFYFGMGSDLKHSRNWKQKELKKETGDILKVCLE